MSLSIFSSAFFRHVFKCPLVNFSYQCLYFSVYIHLVPFCVFFLLIVPLAVNHFFDSLHIFCYLSIFKTDVFKVCLVNSPLVLTQDVLIDFLSFVFLNGPWSPVYFYDLWFYFCCCWKLDIGILEYGSLKSDSPFSPGLAWCCFILFQLA